MRSGALQVIRQNVDPSQLGYRQCVGIALFNIDGYVWVGRRVDAPSDAEGRGSWWQMPQGGIDKGEDPSKAAMRELAEETSITSARIIGESANWLRYDLPPELVGKAWKGKYRGQEQKWYAARFFGPDTEINITPARPHKAEFDAWRWVRLSDVVDLVVPFKRPVYQQVVEAFATHTRPAPLDR
ncbi:MAG: RNA pyrophosphohydrolase [Hyphomicrobium sp.]|nr:RNA pyrophosphohydrolase [Hyphomicrobium sp.]